MIKPRIRMRSSSDWLNVGLDNMRDFFIEGELLHTMVWPMTPLEFLNGFLEGSEGCQLSRYIWGMPGDVVFSKTLKCETSGYTCINLSF